MINIEICKSPNKPGTWNMRIGDIEGSINVYNTNKKDILDLIAEEMKMNKVDIDFDFDALKKHGKEALLLVDALLCTKSDELNSITKEYVNKLLEIANINPKDFDMNYEYVWSYVIGFCYARKVRKERNDKNEVS